MFFFKNNYEEIIENGKSNLPLSPLIDTLNPLFEAEGQKRLKLEEIQTAIYNIFWGSHPSCQSISTSPFVVVTKKDLKKYIDNVQKIPLTNAEKEMFQIIEEIDIDIDMLESL